MPYNMEWGQSGDMMFDSGLYANLDKDLLDSASLSADLEKRSLNDLTEMEETEAEVMSCFSYISSSGPYAIKLEDYAI